MPDPSSNRAQRIGAVLSIALILSILVHAVLACALRREIQAVAKNVLALTSELRRVVQEKEQAHQHYRQLLGELEELNLWLQGQLDKARDRQMLLLEEHRNGAHPPQEEPAVPTQGPAGPVAYLTFDDGPSSITIKVLDILKHYGIKATFFVVGNDTSFGRATYRRMVDEGHALGNHTFSHRYHVIYSSPEAFLDDVWMLQALLLETTGTWPGILRFPGGSNNHVSHQYGGPGIMQQLTRLVLDQGFRYFDWDVTAADATAQPQDPAIMVSRVLNGVRGNPSPIILLHDGAGRTTLPEALPLIIEGLLAMGYSFGVLTGQVPAVRFAR
ncbi:MAG: polysaccharide deacetylase family protein [Bacillota bacterium]